MKSLFYYESPIGTIGLVEQDEHITRLLFAAEAAVVDDAEVRKTDGIREAWRQLGEYFRGERQAFALPLAPAGSPFMQSVWSCLRQIPYGTTQSYRDVARAVGNDKACRAVGMANNRNPIPILIPCHRVIGSGGSLTGYRVGLEIKARLLELERTHGKL